MLLLASTSIILVLVLVVVIEPTSRPPQPLGVPGHWHLVLDSELGGDKLPAPWKQGWWGSGVTGPVSTLEDDCYSPRNVTFGDGSVHLDVTKASSTCGGATRPFTGAIITTNPGDGRGHGFQYTYGVLQVRVYLPADGSTFADWPGVWAAGQPGPAYGEQDVIEGIDGDACWHFHRVSGETGGCDTNLKPGWHTVASVWQKGSVTFYYDGHNVGRITSGVTSAPMYLLLDNAVAGHSTPISDSMRVQYVRVWQRS